ncbi:MAG: hypothetical protein GY710_06130 [Desulfobacteraceae bacterium]|nr:hypothetical protein [Desulfobacteraceae bacterium]
MATVSASGMTLNELSNRIDPKGNLSTIAEVLEENNEILVDPVFMPSNDTYSNTITRRATMPTGTWRGVNQGVDRETSTTITVNEKIGLLQTRSANDVELINAAPNREQARWDEAKPFIEGLGQNFAETMIYGNASATPLEFTGLAPRMGSLGTYVLGNGGTGSDCSSIYVVMWDSNKAFMCYPKSGVGNLGIQHEDKGQQTVLDADSKEYEAFVDIFTMRGGLCVKDDRAIGRVANIESAGDTNIFNEDPLIRLLDLMPKGPKTIYVNQTIKSQMRVVLKDKTNLIWAPDQALSGTPVMFFDGHPVRTVDEILNTEAAIS